MAVINGRLPLFHRLKHGTKLDGRPVKLDYMYLGLNIPTASGHVIDEYSMAQIAAKFPDGHAGVPNTVERLSFVPINLVYDEPDLNINTYFECFDGRKIKPGPFNMCKGNGTTAQRIGLNGQISEVSCPGPDKCPGMVYTSDKGYVVKACKLQGVFDFELRGLDGIHGGLCRYRTTGFNSASNILGFMQWLKVAVGILRGLPLGLVLTENAVRTADNSYFKFFSLNMVLQNDKDKTMLQTIAAHKQREMTHRVESGFSMQDLQQNFRGMLTATALEFDEEDAMGEAESTDPDHDALQADSVTAEPIVKISEAQAAQEEVKKGQRKRAKTSQLSEEELAKEMAKRTADMFPEGDETPV